MSSVCRRSKAPEAKTFVTVKYFIYTYIGSVLSEYGERGGGGERG